MCLTFLVVSVLGEVLLKKIAVLSTSVHIDCYHDKATKGIHVQHMDGWMWEV